MEHSGFVRPILSPARKALRDGTHAVHVELNQHPLLAGITKTDYPLENYRTVLLAYFYFYCAVEAAIDSGIKNLGSTFDYEPRRKLGWIRKDLAHFGIDPIAGNIDSDISVSQLKFDSIAELVGALYTVEGSSLGGQVISRHIAATHNLTLNNGARFFHGYGENIPLYWEQFESFMDSELGSEDSLNQAIAMAKRIFLLMKETLNAAHVASKR